jgi:uncharacterized oxidoreductase
MELRNNTILITGGTSGFGLEFAAQLQKLGNTILITGRNASKLDETRRRLPGIHTFQSDVSDPKAIESLYQQVTKQFPDLNILINNAGEMRRIILQDAATAAATTTAATTSDTAAATTSDTATATTDTATATTTDTATATGLSDITREIDINLSGPIRMIQQFLPHLLKRSSAAIINVTSGLALVPLPLAPVYGATKSGLRSYTQSLRAQLKHTPIKVFELVAPGARTPLNDKFAGDVDAKMLMEPDKLIAVGIKGIQKDKLTIYPGLARVIRIMSRLAPGLLLNQMSKMSEKAMDQKS